MATFCGAQFVISSKPNILFTASTLPRWQGDTEPEFILQLGRALSTHYRVTILAPHCAGSAREEMWEEVRILRYRYAPAALETLAYGGGIMANLKAQRWRWLLVPGLLFSQLFSIWRLCRQQRFAVIHAHWIIPQGLALILGGWLGWQSPPVLLTSHGADLFALRSRPLRWLKRQILRHAWQVNVVSRAMLAECEALGLQRNEVVVRSMGVDLQQRFVATTPWVSRDGLVFVGRLVEKKGVDILIRAFATVCNSFPEVRLSIIGDGPLRDTLEALARELGCHEQIEFAGAIANREVPARLNGHQIALVPSVIARDGDQEGLGLVAVEAMGCGCAVICSDLAALADVIAHEQTGLVVPAGDSVVLAQAITRLLKHAVESQALAEAGRVSVRQRFDWPRVAADYSQLYRKLMGN